MVFAYMHIYWQYLMYVKNICNNMWFLFMPSVCCKWMHTVMCTFRDHVCVHIYIILEYIISMSFWNTLIKYGNFKVFTKMFLWTYDILSTSGSLRTCLHAYIHPCMYTNIQSEHASTRANIRHVQWMFDMKGKDRKHKKT